jgi:hypothetical protein
MLSQTPEGRHYALASQLSSTGNWRTHSILAYSLWRKIEKAWRGESGRNQNKSRGKRLHDRKTKREETVSEKTHTHYRSGKVVRITTNINPEEDDAMRKVDTEGIRRAAAQWAQTIKQRRDLAQMPWRFRWSRILSNSELAVIIAAGVIIGLLAWEIYHGLRVPLGLPLL